MAQRVNIDPGHEKKLEFKAQEDQKDLSQPMDSYKIKSTRSSC